ncbi:MAG: futalosine hydrolase [Candidatus Paceibacteria bacterium]|jgi:futalosine hydrolase
MEAPASDTLAMTVSLGSPTLLLVPTELEHARLQDLGGFTPGTCLVSLCGFGPVASAARTAQLLGQLRPKRVLLVGIAGAYDTEQAPVGSALEFEEVAMHGIGAGEGTAFEGPPALGFPQWPGSPGTTKHPVVDSLPLACPKGVGQGTLLTTCAAAKQEEQSRFRQDLFGEAVAEDMEGFAVAMACALAQTPLRIIRGISNRVADRDPATWRIPAALAAARDRAQAILANTDWEER